MPTNQVIAKTSVAFSADTSQLNRGVAAAENRLQKFSKGAAEKFDKFSEKGKKTLSGLAGKAGVLGEALDGLEGLGGMAGLASEFGVVGIIIAGIGIAASKVMADYQEQLDAAKRVGEELDKKILEKQQSAFNKKLTENNAIPNSIQRAVALSQQYQKINKEIEGVEGRKNKILKDQEKYEESITNQFLKRNAPVVGQLLKPPKFVMRNFGHEEGAQRDFEGEIKGESTRLDQMNAQREKILEAYREIKTAATTSIQTQIDNLRIQNKTFGQSAEAVDRYKASLVGVDKNLLRIAAIEEDRLKKKQAAAEIKKGVDDLNKSLAIQVATWGKSAEQVQIYEMRVKGASLAQLQQAMRTANVIGALRERDKLLEDRKAAAEKLDEFKPKAAERSHDLQAITSGSTEAINALTRAKADFALQHDADKRNADERKKQTDLLKSIDDQLKKVDLIIKGGGR